MILSLSLETGLKIGNDRGRVFNVDGMELMWVNPTESRRAELSCSVRNPNDYSPELRVMRQFLSRLAFQTSCRIVEASNAFGVGAKRPISSLRTQTWNVFPSDLTVPTCLPAKQGLDVALALYREGLGCRTAFSSFLNYYKVLTALFGEGNSALITWVNDNAIKVSESDEPTRDFLVQLRKRFQSKTVAHILQDHYRHSVAHASRKPRVSPDNPADLYDLRRVERLIHQLARRALKMFLARR